MSTIKMLNAPGEITLNRDNTALIKTKSGDSFLIVVDVDASNDEQIVSSMKFIKRSEKASNGRDTSYIAEFESVTIKRDDIESMTNVKMEVVKLTRPLPCLDSASALHLEFVEDNNSTYRASYDIGSAVTIIYYPSRSRTPDAKDKRETIQGLVKSFDLEAGTLDITKVEFTGTSVRMEPKTIHIGDAYSIFSADLAVQTARKAPKKQPAEKKA